MEFEMSDRESGVPKDSDALLSDQNDVEPTEKCLARARSAWSALCRSWMVEEVVKLFKLALPIVSECSLSH